MKTSFLLRTLAIALLVSAISYSTPALGDNRTSIDLLNKAVDLVHQARNPDGDMPSNAQRIDLLNQALELLNETPDHHLRGHRVEAIRDINVAVGMLKSGDPDDKAGEALREADSELRTALSLAD